MSLLLNEFSDVRVRTMAVLATVLASAWGLSLDSQLDGRLLFAVIGLLAGLAIGGVLRSAQIPRGAWTILRTIADRSLLVSGAGLGFVVAAGSTGDPSLMVFGSAIGVIVGGALSKVVLDEQEHGQPRLAHAAQR